MWKFRARWRRLARCAVPRNAVPRNTVLATVFCLLAVSASALGATPATALTVAEKTNSGTHWYRFTEVREQTCMSTSDNGDRERIRITFKRGRFHYRTRSGGELRGRRIRTNTYRGRNPEPDTTSSQTLTFSRKGFTLKSVWDDGRPCLVYRLKLLR